MTQTQALSDDVLTANLVQATPTKQVCLYPLNDLMRRIDLNGLDRFHFGRPNFQQVIAPNVNIANVVFFQSVSKDHFIIVRKADTPVVGHDSYILKDMSRFGTFVNNKPVPLPKKEITLQSGDSIGLHQRLPLFLFFDERDSITNQFPKEVTDTYVVTRKLGAGACGEVFLVYEHGSGVDRGFALKCVSKRKFGLSSTADRQNGSSGCEKVRKEVQILSELSHPCVVALERCVETDDMLYIVMEYVAGGELFDRLRERIESHSTGFPESIAKVLFFQLVHAVAYLHQNSVTHRDLKPENVLLSSSKEDETRVKLTDFGLSKMVDANTIMRTFCGTPQYVAPEVIQTNGEGQYSPAIDCWSLGVILFVMLGGYPPFTSERPDLTLREQILSASYSFPDQYWKNVSSNAIDLVRKLLTLDPDDRISAQSVLKHSWFDDERTKSKVSQLMGLPAAELLNVGAPQPDTKIAPATVSKDQPDSATGSQRKSTSTTSLSSNSFGKSAVLSSGEEQKSGESRTDSESFGDLRHKFAVSHIRSQAHNNAHFSSAPVVQTRARTRAGDQKRILPPQVPADTSSPKRSRHK